MSKSQAATQPTDEDISMAEKLVHRSAGDSCEQAQAHALISIAKTLRRIEAQFLEDALIREEVWHAPGER